MKVILGIDTSCDDTGVGVVIDGQVASNVVATQTELHEPFGGVMPEAASREHLKVIQQVADQALQEAGVTMDDLDLVAATRGPGLIGALLVGLNFGKALAMARGLPFLSVNHLEGHIASSLVGSSLETPFLSLIASGGHTSLFAVDSWGDYRELGRTRDDAAGEAFDKVARYLGLGYPGGPAIDSLAMEGDPEAIAFPRPMIDQGYDFSFSGLKTSVVNHVRKNPNVSTADVAASFQAAVVDTLVTKARRAAADVGARSLGLGGGVAANSLLRERLLSVCVDDNLQAYVPSRAMCTDNAAMVAAAGWYRLKVDGPSPLDLGAQPNLRLPTVA